MLARWYLREALRVLALLDEPRDWADARALDAWLVSHGNCTTREAQQYGPVRDKTRRDAALAVLLAANAIVAVLPTDTPLNIQAFAHALGEQSRKANEGDLSRGESMLMAQAHTLNALFTALTRRAAVQEYLNQYETYMRLALKAQSQCRHTRDVSAHEEPAACHLRPPSERGARSPAG
jgi:hypothetical protein